MILSDGYKEWEIIVYNTQTKQEHALVFGQKSFCPICLHPLNESNCSFHPGLIHIENKIHYLCGDYLIQDWKKIPHSWFSIIFLENLYKPYNNIDRFFVDLILYRIKTAHWDLHDSVATMIPTKAPKYNTIFSNISKALQMHWIPFDQLFLQHLGTEYSKSRKEFIQSKYTLSPSFSIALPKKILIFDDVMNQGYTFGRCIDLLIQCGTELFYLISIARIVGYQYFPSKIFPKL